MATVLDYIVYAVIASFHLTHVARKSRVDRTTTEYLRTVSDVSLLSDLSDALEPVLCELSYIEQIFDKFAVKSADRKSFWIEQCLVHSLNAIYGVAQAIGPSIPLLWQYFCSAASFR